MNGLPWNERTCAHAVENEHWDVIQWAQANGCLCNEGSSKKDSEQDKTRS
jgi:hypothetical protein